MTTNENLKNKKLLDDFPPVNYDEWFQEATASLKGKPVDKLIVKTYEGIEVKPIYNSSDVENLSLFNDFPGFLPFSRGTDESMYKNRAWKVEQHLNYYLPDRLNQSLKNELKNGQDSIFINIINPDFYLDCEKRIRGTFISSVEDFEIIFKAIDITKYDINLKVDTQSLGSVFYFFKFLEKNNIDVKSIAGTIQFDFISELSEKGSLPYQINEYFDFLSNLINWLKIRESKLKIISLNSSNFGDSGANAVQELAFSFSAALEYIYHLSERNIDINEIASQIKFNFSIGNDFFMEIAKFRTARLVWTKITSELNIKEEYQKINFTAKSNIWNKSKFDSFTNLLRSTTESISAIIGGCDALTVHPYNINKDEADEFSSRIARNTQNVLLEECNLTDVIDPAGGSYYVETLTSEIASKVWRLFKDIESMGGYLNALEAGYPQTAVSEIAKFKINNLLTRKDSLVGINQHPDLNEEFTTENFNFFEIALNEYQKGNSEKNIIPISDEYHKAEPEKQIALLINNAQNIDSKDFLSLIFKEKSSDSITPFMQFNPLHPFEELRINAKNYKDKTGEEPKIFAAAFGPIKQHKARVDFSTGFFNVGGFHVLYSKKGYDSTDEAIQAYIDSKAKIMVICSTDDTYPDIIESLVPKVKEQIPGTIAILAGYPTEHIEKFRTLGIDDFIHIKANVYEILKKLYDKINNGGSK